MFEFKGVESTEQHQKLRANCSLDAKLTFFTGHFDGQPLMPAAAQLQMIDALMQSQKAWRSRILGGRGVKFMQPILPDETIGLRLVRLNSTSIEFSLIKTGMSVATKGTLAIAEVTID